MAALHQALKTLSPVSFADIPVEEPILKEYLQAIFSNGQLLIDSVPPPLADVASTTGRPRSGTASSIASNVSEISSSSARAEALIPAHAALQKEWGKPIKLAAKDNPMGIGVYKLSGKDGRAWFARRSVHEGMPYHKWKIALQSEFPESLEIQGAPGEGNIRGIGAERSVEKRVVKGVGSMEVYHLSAQFPGPTAPRDFVEVLLTSSAALSRLEVGAKPDEDAHDTPTGDVPRHFMVISKPCKHPDCPPRDGFVRGEYESIEFIREIPKEPRRSSSTTDLTKPSQQKGIPSSINKEAVLRNARQKSEILGMSLSGSSDAQLSSSSTPSGGILSSSTEHTDGRARGRTISFAESRGKTAKGEAFDRRHDESDDDTKEVNPVEWIMITRSDPGGSVPRFMVERGTPSSIVADASKFLNWACQKQHPANDKESYNLDKTEDAMTESTTADDSLANGRVTTEDGATNGAEEASHTISEKSRKANIPETVESLPQPKSIVSNIANAAVSTISSYAPQSVLDRLPPTQETTDQTPSLPSQQSADISKDQDSDSVSTLSNVSFASADSHLSTITSTKSILASPTPSASTSKQSQSPREKEIAKLAARKAKLDDALRQTRDKETKDKEALTSKEEARVRKAEEKHAREIKRAEEKFEKEMKAIDEKKRKEEEKRKKAKVAEDEKQRKQREVEADVERKRKEKEERECAEKVRQDMKGQLEAIQKEKDLLLVTVTNLQRENTALVAAIGKLDGGQAVLDVLKKELA
ncbi:hypothetical protein MMC13_006959 [Lambiella insularis]|nr:hypothetical protein [Lambiella insularis]